MDYKQKYEQALEYMRTVYPTLTGAAKEDVEHHFPELKESEDEKIRKALKSFFDSEISDYGNVEWRNGIRYGEIVAWLEKQGGKIDIVNKGYWRGYREGKQEIIDKYSELEKQGEQTPSDKVEPRFHEGDWVVYKKDICQIVKREEGCNKLVTVFGIEKELVNERNLSTARLWTIQDANEGDVLCAYPESEYPWIGIFHKLNAEGGFISHCYLQAGRNSKFCPPSGENIFGKRNVDNHSPNVVPATKEQRDLLFQKMKEAGYEWDAEKKELKKIEPKTAENKGMNLVEEEMTPFQKKVFFIIDTAIEEEQGLKQVCDELLRLAHDEFMQNPAWSEEDEWKFSDILALLRGGENFHYNTPELFDWLKSIKERYTWKPSNEQMEVLNWCKPLWSEPKTKAVLESLIEDLKKLKGE